MKKLNLIHKFGRWRVSRVELLREVETLRKENERMRQRLIDLQQAKDQAEKHAEDRRREKEGLRLKLASQKKAFDSHELQIQQLGAKITELRAENDKLKRAKKK